MAKSRRTRARRTGAAVRARRAGAAAARLVRVMDTLRSRHGCPWDRDQTHRSLRPHIVEETYELIDAIDRDSRDAMVEEIGDVLFQCVFHAQIGAEAGQFDLADAIHAITAKLIRRHPHVFTSSGRPIGAGARSRTGVTTATAVKEQWEKIKAREREGRERRGVLSGIPRSMPALLRAHEVGRRVAAVGFDWPDVTGVLDKIEEETSELRAAVTESPARAAEEFGDLLFSIANLARKLGIEPEAALRAANDKFTRRFDAIETALERDGRTVHTASTDDLEAAWQRIKQPPTSTPASSSSVPRGRGRRSRG